MKNNFAFILIISFFITLNVSGQDNTALTKEQFGALINKLTIEKTNFLSEEERFKVEIDSLKTKLSLLEEQFKSCRRTKLLKKYGKEIANRILKGQIWKGMTESMLGESWGKPDRIDTNKEKWGVFSQWYYGNITYFFRDGSMIDWEETK